VTPSVGIDVRNRGTVRKSPPQAYRKNPTFLESKTPGGPGTAAHCERFAELDRQAAKEARDLASAHEHMAAAKEGPSALQSVTRRNSWAFSATMIVLADMSTAPAAGDMTSPQRDRTPAARGMAMTLYPAAHQRFCTIFR
jgi:hypothetical protein